MKIGKVSNAITALERAKVADLPAVPNCYLEIEKVDELPGTGTDGQVVQLIPGQTFHLWEDTAWVEVLFSMEKVNP